MFFAIYLFLFISVVGLTVVSSNPMPNFGALGLVVVAGGGCGLLACLGSPFLSLVLFLIYLGGMLVVFAYSIAFTTSLKLDHSENITSFLSFMMFFDVVLICKGLSGESLNNELWIMEPSFYNNSLIQETVFEVAFLYSESSGFLMVGSFALLLALLIVLMVVRDSSYGALRAV